jgi:glyoxylase-like metal-dependent hydrolase (beta-lactamase superfamily II)
LVTNCYLLSDQASPDSVWVIDPADDLPRLLEAIGKRKLAGIVCTHRHFDHIGALAALQHACQVTAYCGRLEHSAITTNLLEQFSNETVEQSDIQDVALRALDEGERLSICGSDFEVLHTPGHSAGSICLYNAESELLFSGDTLFFRAYGRYDLPSGDYTQLATSLSRLAKLPGTVCVYPGHGQNTTIGSELTSGALQMRG